MTIFEVLKHGVLKRASDIHIMSGVKPLLRVDGILTAIKEFPVLSAEETKNMLFSLLTQDEQEIFSERLVYEMALSVPGIGNFRASIFHDMHGVGAVFRIVPAHIPTLDELNVPEVCKSLLTLPFGLVLVCGPTGSGKSTTLASFVDYINRYRICKILTIEDPIEYIHDNKRSIIAQLQVGRDAQSFPLALRSALRQDSNIIMLGELRDLETMRLALVAAETGHLVLATLHASSAPLSINRFADVFPAHERSHVRTLLAETLQGVICQRLVKKIDGGRTAAFEIMLVTSAIRHYIQQDMPASMESTMQTSGDKGMITFDWYLHDMVKRRIITSLVAASVLNEIKIFKDRRDTNKK